MESGEIESDVIREGRMSVRERQRKQIMRKITPRPLSPFRLLAGFERNYFTRQLPQTH